MMTVLPARMLPLRVPVAHGEAMDSWLEALARRNQITVRKLVAAMGWHVPNAPAGLVAGIPGAVLRHIEYQAGLPAARLDDAVLDRYGPARVVRSRGSRYCPCCLAELDGRWLLAWRLPWTFVCTTHRMLLRDTCPECGQVPRVHAGQAGLNPPGTCPSPVARGTCCGAGLHQETARRPARDSAMLAAQHWIDMMPADAAGNPGPVGTLDDVGSVASWVLRHAPATHFAQYGAEAMTAWQRWHEQPPAVRDQPRRCPPASAALTAALAATTMTILSGDTPEAAGRIRELMPPATGPRPTRPPACPASTGSRCHNQPEAVSCAPWTMTSAPPIGSATAPARPWRAVPATARQCWRPAPG